MSHLTHHTHFLVQSRGCFSHIFRLGNSVVALTSATGLCVNRNSGLRLLERPPPLGLAKSEENEGRHDKYPVEIVRDDGTVSTSIVPAEDSVEDAPASIVRDIRVAAL